MTKKQLQRQLQLIHKDLTRGETRMNKISDKLGIGENHEFLERTIYEVEELLKMFEEKENVLTEV